MKVLIFVGTVMIVSSFAMQAEAQTSLGVTSTAFKAGSMIPTRYTCKGANQNPPLEFNGIPAGAKSLALVVDDPDAPGGVFNHWLVWNIDPVTKQILANRVPAGAMQGENDFGK